MANRIQKLLVSNSPSVNNGFTNRRIYHKPWLEELGDLRSLTLGGSPGVGESSNPFSYKPKGTAPQPGDFPIFNPDGTIRNPDDPITTP